VRLVHLTASTFFGGPERQMLGLAKAMPDRVHTTFASFPEGGRSAAFLNEVRAAGFPAISLTRDFPRILATLRELTALLRDTRCDVLFCHGYKADVLGRLAARRAGISAVAVSRGWTGESRKVKLYEWLDRRHLRFMDRVVCVSEGQAAKVRRWCGVRESRLSVIRNSARLAAFETRDPAARERLLVFFPNDISHVVLAAGRLSPEKGFGVLVEAAATICRDIPGAGVVLFGEGALRTELEKRVAELGLAGRVVMPGFRTDLDSLIGAADVVVLPSFTEGLPNVALEASAAGVPVVATAVGGTPEVVRDGETGYLVPAGQPAAIAAKVGQLLRDPALRAQFGAAAKECMQTTFTFEAQARAYLELIDTLLCNPVTRSKPDPGPSPARGGASPPSLAGKGVGGLGSRSTL
jgi:glycosyltransferase involved in cell wall biosynthesis